MRVEPMMASTCGAIPAATPGGRVWKSCSTAWLASSRPPKMPDERAQKDAEREQRHHERERHCAGHGESAVLVKAVDGLEHGAVTLHT